MCWKQGTKSAITLESVSPAGFGGAPSGDGNNNLSVLEVALMKSVLAILAVAVVIAAGGVAAFDYTVGGVGLFGSCPSCCSGESEAPVAAPCSSCCDQGEAACPEACQASPSEKADCSACPSTKAAKECPVCPASATPSEPK